MKVKELKELLKKVNEEADVFIEYDSVGEWGCGIVDSDDAVGIVDQGMAVTIIGYEVNRNENDFVKIN